MYVLWYMYLENVEVNGLNDAADAANAADVADAANAADVADAADALNDAETILWNQMNRRINAQV